MHINKTVFFTLAFIYLLVLFITGGFAAAMAIGANTPPPQDLVVLEGLSAETKEQFYISLRTSEEKTRKLSETATNGFQIVLGALIGFLSAVGATIAPTKADKKFGGDSGESSATGGASPELAKTSAANRSRIESAESDSTS